MVIHLSCSMFLMTDSPIGVYQTKAKACVPSQMKCLTDLTAF